MKNRFTWLVMLFVCVSTVCRASVAVTLADHGHSNWQIVQTSAKEEITFAAGELQKYLAQISNAQLPITGNLKTSYNIIIGLRTDIPSKYQSIIPAGNKGYDGYSVAILAKPAVIIIAGDNNPGVIYGVYDLLEHLGCRWYYPTEDSLDMEVVPKLNKVLLTSNSWSVASHIKYRICNPTAFYLEVVADKAIKQVDWAMKNRYNMIGWQFDASKYQLIDQYKKLGEDGILAEIQKRGMFMHGPAHAFDQLLSSDKYFAKHPEWFGMRNGKRVPQTFLGAQFCWSNPNARKQFVENAAAFIKQAPLIKIFCTVPFDGGQACECDQCKKAGASNLLMTLEGELIDKIKTSNPGVMVETVGGYGAVVDPPTDLNTINPKQRIIFAQWGRYHGYGYADPRYDNKSLDQWRKAAKGGLTICNYYTDNFAEPWVMMPFTKAMASDRAYMLKNKVDAVYLLMWAPGFWWNHSLNGAVAGRIYYDVSLDPLKEIDDYAFSYYGRDAGPLIAAYYKERANNIDVSYHLRGGSATYADSKLLAAERRNLISPAIKKAKNNKLYSYRLSKLEKLHTLDENLAVASLMHNRIKRLRTAGAFDKAALALDSARRQEDKIVNMLYTLADLKQGLIDNRDVAGFTSSALKDWLGEEAKLIDTKNMNPN